MSAPTPALATKYDPFSTEAKWQQYWEENKVFQANPNPSGDPYSIVIPPPNVTGSLHMGHAFEIALIDTLVRYHRMLGRDTLCLPGTDHASIAVHTVLEKQLKAEGTNRYEIGREAFLERAWKWRGESGGTIVNQLKRMGLSADWSRERFTLDPQLRDAVVEAFVRLHDEGLIYRGNYLVNWCPESQSAVSDLEVENREVKGHLWHFRYPLAEGDGFVEVATTRPETMLGDTGVAVNPQDERYQGLIGKTLTLPLIGREIPIFADDLVDVEFGTGCVKVTPAHDPNDFEMGQRHNLPFINILNKDGTLNENAGDFAGQDRFVARENVVRRLEEEGLLVKVEDYDHTVPYSDRGKVPVEPLLSTQWFVTIAPLSQKALECLDGLNSPRFVPPRWQKVYRDWLVRLRDWCISRQLWWGHQIPAWYAISETDGQITDSTPFVVAHNEEEAWEKAVSQFGENVKLEQDPDVLDTWFSSGLWPFSTMGWPQDTEDLKAYYPNTTLVTGFDIIFFWVARMTMMAGHFTGEMPFKDVYIHGLVRDENGKKMSKSSNNGIDPLILVNKYGTDALRYTLIREVAGAGQDISLQYDRKTDQSESVEASRNFANKLWNAARFVLMNLEGKTPEQLGYPQIEDLEMCDRWILSRFYRTVQQTRNYVDTYGLGEAAKGLYDFIWGDFCDWYIELVKPRLREEANSKSRQVAQQTLAYVLEGILKLLHPFMPHITEEIWHTLTQKTEEVLTLQSYPDVDEILKENQMSESTDPVTPEPNLEPTVAAQPEFSPEAVPEELQAPETPEPESGKTAPPPAFEEEVVVEDTMEHPIASEDEIVVEDTAEQPKITPSGIADAIAQSEETEPEELEIDPPVVKDALSEESTQGQHEQPETPESPSPVGESEVAQPEEILPPVAGETEDEPFIAKESTPMSEPEQPTIVPAEEPQIRVVPPSERTESQITQILDQIAKFLGRLPQELIHFFSHYSRPLTVVGVILGIFILISVLGATLDAIHSIPLFSPILQLIGLIYIIWFIIRYVFQSKNRSELTAIFEQLKEQVVGTSDLKKGE
ncbi:valine--tRNA ligase [Lusitaniella coriacea]|uniref:valine--tRNA ligase n=1 Tax=Lusitaniella coriacea TaxID=1983105 RepID=UPI003CEFB4D6